MHTIHILQEVSMISDEEILRKAKTEREMPVEEVLRYQEISQPEYYGKYGSLALADLQNHRIDKLIEINDRLGSAESVGEEAQIIKIPAWTNS